MVSGSERSMTALAMAITSTTIAMTKVEPRQLLSPNMPPPDMTSAISGIMRKVKASPSPPPGPEYISMAKPRSLMLNHLASTEVMGTYPAAATNPIRVRHTIACVKVVLNANPARNKASTDIPTGMTFLPPHKSVAMPQGICAIA